MKKLFRFYEKLPLTWYLAFRRLLPKSDTPGIVLLPRIAFASILIGVSASILILSLANGLHFTFIQRLAESNAHITSVSIGKGIPDYQNVINELKKNEQITDVFPYAEKEALIQSYEESTGILLKSYPSDFANDPIFQKYFHLKEGNWSFDSSRGITIGEALSKSMALFVGDYLQVLIYDEDFGAITYRFRIDGIFTANDANLDRNVAFISFKDASEIFNFQNFAPSIGIRIKDFNKPEKLVAQLNKQFPIRFTSWKIQYLHNLIALQNEKKIIQVLLIIFFVVNYFAILSVMMALVADKREEIALLKALGMNAQDNSQSLLWTGLLLGICASILGIIIGIGASLQFNNFILIIEEVVNFFLGIWGLITQQDFYPFSILNQRVYYLREFPILIQSQDLIFSSLMATICAVTASYYPSRISQKYKAADILRKRAF